MALNNYEFQLKLKQAKYCVLHAGGTDNMNANPDNITFTIKDTKLYVPVAIKSYQNFFVEDLKDQFTDSIKTKIENKNMRNECRHFLKSNLVEVKRLFVLIYLNRSNHVKRLNI